MRPGTNPRVGAYYAAGAVAAGLGAIAAWPWGVVLLWPALAFAVVVAGYLGLGATVYGKRNGVLPLRTRWLLAPVLLGQHLSLRHYERKCRPWDRVTPALWIGKRLNEAEAQALVQEGVTAVLDLTAEFSEVEALRSGAYLNLPVLDLTAPNAEQMRQGVAFLREHAQRGPVYVHCKIGYSRTAAVAGAWLMACGISDSVEDAVALLRRARPTLVLRPEALDALHQFATPCRASAPRTP